MGLEKYQTSYRKTNQLRLMETKELINFVSVLRAELVKLQYIRHKFYGAAEQHNINRPTSKNVRRTIARILTILNQRGVKDV